MLILNWTLAAFGEEMVYRGHLINRVVRDGAGGRAVEWCYAAGMRQDRPSFAASKGDSPRGSRSTRAVLGVVLLAMSSMSGVAVAQDRPDWNPDAATAYLEARVSWWMDWPTAVRERGTACVSCHTVAPFALVRSLPSEWARPALAGTVARRLLDSVETRVVAWHEVGPYYSDEEHGHPKTSESRGTEAILNALVLAVRDAGTGRVEETTRQAFEHLWSLQLTDGAAAGAWPWLDFGLEPWEGSGGQFYGAALAGVAVGMMPEGYAAAPDVRPGVTRLSDYLNRQSSTTSLFNRLTALWAFTLLGGGLDEAQRAGIVEEAFGAQDADGGWSLASLGTFERLDGTSLDTVSDGYATGLAVLALHGEATARDDARLARGIGWLRRHQEPDGSWSATSLNREREATSERGRFMRDAATAYASLALGQVDADAPASTTPPRTSWGTPDLSGVWDFRTLTPLERPEAVGDQAVLTAEDAAAFRARALEARDADRRDGGAGRDVERAYNDFWWDYGDTLTTDLRTSLIVDPPDGRIPARSAGVDEADRARRAARRRPVRERVVIGSPAHGPEDLGLSERCMLGFNAGPPMLPSAYNNNIQIVQTRDHVAIVNEMIHDARIVPLGDVPQLPSGVRQWMGDSRGRWDGDTLIVETTNFTARTGSFYTIARSYGSGETLRLVERFTRDAPDRLRYEFTVHDEHTFTRSFTAEIPMTRTDARLYEYACHEGNYGMSNLLAGARALERATGGPESASDAGPGGGDR